MMDKSININIAGTLFRIEDDAYKLLRDYLQELNNRFRKVRGGMETIEDIEGRIAEIFTTQKGVAGVITSENVREMISIIGNPEDFDNIEAEPEAVPVQPVKKRLYRNPDDMIISGVCGGIGAYLKTDPVLFRVLFAISTVSFGVGAFLYAALWIALPPANTEARKRELHGSTYVRGERTGSSRISDVLNEIFRAAGRVLYICLRIILILLGITMVLTGFLIIVCLVMILVFKYPPAIYGSGFEMNLLYLSDFLKYIVNPVFVPWMIALTLTILVIPFTAVIYWGVKMIFWFRAKEGIFSLAAFVFWVMLIAVLAVILFNEGLSLSETAKNSYYRVFQSVPDTLHIKAGKKLTGSANEKELNFSEHGYNIVINDERKELQIRPFLKVCNSENENPRIEIRKRSSGRSEADAMKKTEDLSYNFSLEGDTLTLDEYFTIPAGRKWAADNIGINLYLPEGTVLELDSISQRLLHSDIAQEYYSTVDKDGRTRNIKLWVLTEDGLEPVDGPLIKHK